MVRLNYGEDAKGVCRKSPILLLSFIEASKVRFLRANLSKKIVCSGVTSAYDRAGRGADV